MSFVPNNSTAIPGYTGHRPAARPDAADIQQPKEPRKQIPGYAGYIPAIKSENIFGETYGKTSLASAQGTTRTGIDQPAAVKFATTAQKSFINHADIKGLETVAQLVGVQRGEDMYKVVSDS